MSGIKVKIEIAGRQYPLNVKPEEELMLRKAGKEINELVRSFERQFAINDKQDVLAMICLQLNGKIHKLQEQNQNQNQEIQKKLDKFSQIIDNTSS